MLACQIASKILYSFAKVPIAPADFAHLSTVDSNDLQMTVHQYSHIPTQARIYHFQNQDSQRAFASIVKTFARNNSGCPHILEHLVCCGSEKYPIRDPFFNMIKRSVNSYMNAWTGDDFTAYPFASANSTDWANLYKVYLDMSFRPLLNKLDFRQEGWRFQIDENRQCQFKGIVLNEMKGAYQNADRQMMLAINEELLRGTPYVYDSGGKPAEIVNLSYDQLKSMHNYYYHPSNMSFYFYGSGQISEELGYLSKEYLSKYSNLSSQYEGQRLKIQPVKEKYKNIISHTSECNSISISYVLGEADSISPAQSLFLKFLSYLLLDKSNALVYKEFIQSGIAQNIGFSGLNEGKITTFTITLKGIYPDYQHEALERKLADIFRSIIQKGADPQRLEEFVHQAQIKMATPRQTNGIKILEESIFLLNHRLDLEPYLNLNRLIEEMKGLMSSPENVRQILAKYFLENKQMVVIRQLMAENQEKPEELKSKFIVAEAAIEKTQEELKQRQNEKQDDSILPTLTLADLHKTVKKQPILIRQLVGNKKTFSQYHIKIKEDINFYRLVFNFAKVDQHFLKRIMLWTFALNKSISTASFTYNELATKLQMYTSGFNVFSSLGHQDEFNIIFQFSCLKKNVGEAFNLLKEMIMSPVFQKEHTLNCYRAFANEVTESLIQNPMEECLAEAGSNISLAGSLHNSYQQIKDSLEITRSQNIEELYKVTLQLHKAPNIYLIEHSNSQSLESIEVINNLLKIEGSQMEGKQWLQSQRSKAVIHGYGVNFCSQQYPGPTFLSYDYAQMCLILQILQQEYLHPRIRQQGGAYGTSARLRNGNAISLSSYFDPNSEETFKIFDQSVEQFLSKRSIETQKLNEAKIMQLAEVDRVRPPQAQGVSQILKKYSEEDFDRYRQMLKNSRFQQLIQVGQRYLKKQSRSRCVFGKQCPSQFEEQKLKSFLI